MANTMSSSASRVEGKASSARTCAFSITAFVAVERFRLTEPSGRIGHAGLQLGPSVLLCKMGRTLPLRFTYKSPTVLWRAGA